MKIETFITIAKGARKQKVAKSIIKQLLYVGDDDDDYFVGKYE